MYLRAISVLVFSISAIPAGTDTWRQLRRRHGISIRYVKRGVTSIESGIELVNSRIRTGRLKLVKGAVKCLVEECSSYRYPSKDEETMGDKPIALGARSCRRGLGLSDYGHRPQAINATARLNNPMIDTNDGNSAVLNTLLARMGGKSTPKPQTISATEHETTTEPEPTGQGSYPWGDEWLSIHNDLLFEPMGGY